LHPRIRPLVERSRFYAKFLEMRINISWMILPCCFCQACIICYTSCFAICISYLSVIFIENKLAKALKATAALFLLSSLRHFLRILLSSISVSAALYALAISVHAPFSCF
jgi:hypothetical protein